MAPHTPQPSARPGKAVARLFIPLATGPEMAPHPEMAPIPLWRGFISGHFRWAASAGMSGASVGCGGMTLVGRFGA